MKVSVDLSRCEDHGQCVFAAPQIFALDDDGKFFGRRLTDGEEWVSDDIDESERDAVEDAVMICPVQAITVLEEE
jgi:ferredoxin